MVNTAKILALDVAATSGPWSWDEDVGRWCRSRLIRPVPISEVLSPEYNGEGDLTIRVSPEDAALIEHYRTACPEAARELDQLRDRITALSAPAEGVDLEEVLRRAARLGVADLGDLQGDAWCDMVDQVVAAPALARALMAERDHVHRLMREEARLHDEIGHLRSALGTAEQQRNAAHAAGSNIAAENERLADALRTVRNEAEEARLTLAAEQGKPEGAPSNQWYPRWLRGRLFWDRGEVAELPEITGFRLSDGWRWSAPGIESLVFSTAREMMIDANARMVPRP